MYNLLVHLYSCLCPDCAGFHINLSLTWEGGGGRDRGKVREGMEGGTEGGREGEH